MRISAIQCRTNTGQMAEIPVTELLQVLSANGTPLGDGIVPKSQGGRYIASGISVDATGQIKFDGYRSDRAFTGIATGIIGFTNDGRLVTLPLQQTSTASNPVSESEETMSSVENMLSFFSDNAGTLASTNILNDNGNYSVGGQSAFWKWDVNAGSINIDQRSNTITGRADGYRINGKLVLSYNPITKELTIGNATYKTTNIQYLKSHSVAFNINPVGVVMAPGVMSWNDTYGTVEIGLKGGNLIYRLGQSSMVYVKHADNSGLTKGTVVYPVGSDGSNKTVRLARANTESTSSKTFGVIAETVTGGQKAFCITEGLVENINTSSLTEGSAVYLSPSVAGGFTTTKPSAPNHMVLVGFCIKSHAVNGSIFVKVQNGFEIDELHDVAIGTLANNNLLAYEAGTSLWKNKTFAELGIVSGTGTTNFVTKWSNATGGLIDSQIFDDGTSVGINNLEPAYTLDVSGTVRTINLLITSGATDGNFLKCNNVNGTSVWSPITTSDITNLSSFTGFDSRYFTETESDARFVALAGSYVNPSWITSLAWTKLTGVPTTFAPSAHTHAAVDIVSGVIATARLAASGTASATTFLRGDQTWATLPAPTLTSTRIGFGNGSDLLTSSANFTFEADRIIAIKEGTTSKMEVARYIGSSNYGLYVHGGNLELRIMSGGGSVISQSNHNFQSRILLNNAAGTAGQVLTSQGDSANPTWTTIGSGAITGTGTINYLPKFTSASTLGNSQIFDDGVNVGIGTPSPSEKLTIGTGAVNHKILIRGTVADVEFGNDTLGLKIGTANNGNIYFTTNAAERLRISNLGNVGIGTDNPSTRLTVAGTVSINTAVQSLVMNSASGVYSTYQHNGTSVGDIGTSNQAFFGGSTADFGITSRAGKLVLGAGTVARMYIDTTGNVGIGTATPADRLTVEGGNIGVRSGNFIRLYHSGNNNWSTISSPASGAFAINTGGLNNAFYITTGGNVGIGTPDPTLARLQVSGSINQSGFTNSIAFANADGTLVAANAANIASTLGAGNYYINNQNSIYQPANFKISGDGYMQGSLWIGDNAGAYDVSLHIGNGRTANGYSYIDLVGDTTYTDFGFRIIRNSSGPNTNSTIQHRGAGALLLHTVEAGGIVHQIGNNYTYISNASGNSHYANTHAFHNVGFNGTQGFVYITPGNTTNAGYLSIYNSSQSRLGYIGYNNTHLTYASEGTANHVFLGNKVLIGSTAENGSKVLQVNGGIRQTDVISGLVFANAQGEFQAATGANIAATLGAGNYIQNQYAAAQTANAWISGDFRSNDKIISSRKGYFGLYNSSQVQGLWSIGSSYQIDTTANNFGTQYGLVYSFETPGVALPNGTTTKSAITGWLHQVLFTNSGVVTSGISLTLGNTWQLGQAVFGNYSTTLYGSTSYSIIHPTAESYLANNLQIGKTGTGGILRFRRPTDGLLAGAVGFIDNNTINITSFGGGGIISFTTSTTEKMRITDVGRLLVGYNADVNTYKVQINSGSATDNGLYVNGHIRATGNIIADGFFSGTSSDLRYKSNFEAVKVLNVIDKINVYSYNHKLYNDARLIGSVAQELEKYFPQLITKDTNGYLRVDNYGYSALALQLGKEIKSEVDLLKDRVKELEAKIQTLEKE